MRALLTALVAAVLGAGVTLIVTDNGPDRPPGTPRHTVTVELGGPGVAKVALDPAEQAEVRGKAADVAAGDTVQAEAGLHDTVPPAAGDAHHAEALTPAGQAPIPATLPLATVHQPGCKTALVRNYSYRPAGAPVLLGVIHWTGSRFGTGEAIVRWFDDPRAQASSNYIVDQGGACWLTVADAAKAWTQAGFNPWSVSVEIVNAGVQPLFHDAQQRARVVALMHHWHNAFRIPYRHARVSGCRVTRSGFLAHRDLGQCGGGHPDVGTFDLDGLIREAAGRHPTAKDREDCRRAQAYRARRAAGHVHSDRARAKERARLARLRAHRLRCDPRKGLTAR